MQVGVIGYSEPNLPYRLDELSTELPTCQSSRIWIMVSGTSFASLAFCISPSPFVCSHPILSCPGVRSATGSRVLRQRGKRQPIAPIPEATSALLHVFSDIKSWMRHSRTELDRWIQGTSGREQGDMAKCRQL